MAGILNTIYTTSTSRDFVFRVALLCARNALSLGYSIAWNISSQTHCSKMYSIFWYDIFTRGAQAGYCQEKW